MDDRGKLEQQVAADMEALPEGCARIDVEAVARFYAGGFVRIPFNDIVAMIVKEAERRGLPHAHMGQKI
ncbi:hypothetical protein [Phyllobacterium zundukense]|uniref:Uncharacterized protein n=1 Tax=Phyllobacterium zundukense TaxID=1867719 RepID=A0ACD4CZS8_9HYPH|nr:hypothetical protein [Phyllobacterium zundukense]UXN59053.1 hypothetical protein N8E88_09230 [Phyllobacterium zundukense]